MTRMSNRKHGAGEGPNRRSRRRARRRSPLVVVSAAGALCFSGLAGLAPAAAEQDLWSLARKALGSVTGQETASEETSSQDAGATSAASPLSAVITSADADAALRQALNLGAQSVATRLSATDGFWGDEAVRIALPSRLDQVRNGLAPLGLAGPLDDLELRMNRAAEQAAGDVAPLVMDAVRTMTVDDALEIVRGGDGSATAYLQARTQDALRAKFEPVVRSAMADTGALTALSSVTQRYRLDGLAVNAEDSVTGHVVDAALDGVFHYLAEEEADIRANPARRTTDLLRRVFGG